MLHGLAELVQHEATRHDDGNSRWELTWKLDAHFDEIEQLGAGGGDTAGDEVGTGARYSTTSATTGDRRFTAGADAMYSTTGATTGDRRCTAGAGA